MYFVDRSKIEKILCNIEDLIQLLKRQETWNEKIEKLALERIVHLFIESILDVGNALIDGFIMRDPGSYEDIIDILLDEKVIPSEDEKLLKDIIFFRKILVQDYLEINHEQMLQMIHNSLPALEKFSINVRKYLETELGSLTAFKS